jgi:hypothetical protein
VALLNMLFGKSRLPRPWFQRDIIRYCFSIVGPERTWGCIERLMVKNPALFMLLQPLQLSNYGRGVKKHPGASSSLQQIEPGDGVRLALKPPHG